MQGFGERRKLQVRPRTAGMGQLAHLLSVPEHILGHLRCVQRLRSLAHGPADNAFQLLHTERDRSGPSGEMPGCTVKHRPLWKASETQVNSQTLSCLQRSMQSP